MNQTQSDDQVRSAITAQAAEWFAAQRGGGLDERERAAFVAWLKSSPLHIEEYLALAVIESDLIAATADSTLSLDALRELARSDDASNVTALPSAAPMLEHVAPRIRHPERRQWHALTRGTLVAAGVVAAIVGIAWGVLNRSWLDLPQTYQTAGGAPAVWHLPDGSILHLNRDSAVIAHFSSAERRIDIDHGQAFFEVAHDGSRPFRVIAGSVNAVAVGTEFDVDRRVDSTLITVLQGRVAVFDSPGAAAAAAGTLGNTGPPASRWLQVGAGQQVQISAGQLPDAPSAANLYSAEAWLQRQIVFKHQPLGEVAAEFSRSNAVPITITDPALSALPVSGVFNAYDIDSFMSFLRSLDQVQVDRLPTGIRVSRTRAKPLA
jgi:transmembrane sensor